MNSGCTATSRWVDVGIVLAIVLVLAAGTHLWLTDRLAVLRAFFPLQAQPVKWSGKCSDGAPPWMLGILKEATYSLMSPANQMAYINPDGELHHCQNGWQADMFRSPLVDASTRYRYASVSKLFTADAVLGLVRTGQLQLDSRLMDVFPELPPPQDPRVAQIRIIDLLTHRAGFDRLRSEDPVFKHNHRSWCPYDLSELSRLRLDFAPGERYAYSNRGYCLLGQVVERVTGEDFRRFVEDHYFLSERGIRFVDGAYDDDEVRYDFRTSDFYGPRYSSFFDFHTLSSVAGLSGSAVALAQTVAEMLERVDPHLLSGFEEGCDDRKLQSCYGYSFYRYQPDEKLSLYINEGFFPGTLPLLVVDNKGGILALLPSGTPEARLRAAKKKALIDKLRNYLITYYPT